MLHICMWICISLSLKCHCTLYNGNITVGVLMQPPKVNTRSLDIRSFKPPLDIAIETVKEKVGRKEYLFFDIKYIKRFTETDCGG